MSIITGGGAFGGRWAEIPKPLAAAAPNVADDAAARASFSWARARQALDGLPGGRGLNIAHEARETNRFATLLRGAGVETGDMVVTLLGRTPALYVAALGAMKGGAVYCPLSAAFGPEPIAARLTKARARVLVTTAALYDRKIAPIRLVHRDDDGTVTVVEEPGVEGELALRTGWPSMCRGYVGEPGRYAQCFSGGYYLTGDLATRDADGYDWFVGRADDLIKSSGHLIGPFEVERELLGFARQRLGAAVAPKELAVVAALPRTRSGKIARRVLRARELGLPEGDTSTLEAP